MKKNQDIRIVALQRGWVFIGRYLAKDDYVTLTNASVIRLWGTTKGIGELCDGPTKATKLDPCAGEVRFHRLTEVFSLKTTGTRWDGILG